MNLGPEHRVTLGQMMDKLDTDPGLDASARVNTRENVRLTFDQKVEHVIQEIVESNFDLYKRITDDRAFGEAVKNFLFDQYLRAHRQAEELIKRGQSKTLEFKSTLRWNLKQDRQDDGAVTHAVLKTIAAFLSTEGGDLLIGVADDRSIVGIERDGLETDDQFMRHLVQVVRNGLGDRAGNCIDPKTQIVGGKTVCLASCQRSPEPVFLKWQGLETIAEGDFFVRSGPGTVRLPPDSAEEYMRTRFPGDPGRLVPRREMLAADWPPVTLRRVLCSRGWICAARRIPCVIHDTTRGLSATTLSAGWTLVRTSVARGSQTHRRSPVGSTRVVCHGCQSTVSAARECPFVADRSKSH